MKLRPLHDRVIVKRLEEEKKSAGGIVIPDTAAEKPSMGEVVAAGPGKTDDNGKLVAMGVKVGDKILFGKYSGQEFKLDGARSSAHARRRHHRHRRLILPSPNTSIRRTELWQPKTSASARTHATGW